MDEIEESQAEARLQALEAAVLQDIEQFGACSLVEKAKVQRLQQAVQEKLSAIRSLTRDLELLFEELDRCGSSRWRWRSTVRRACSSAAPRRSCRPTPDGAATIRLPPVYVQR